MIYTVELENGIKEQVEAKDMHEAELIMLNKYGVDAIGLNVVGEHGDFMCTVCHSAWTALQGCNYYAIPFNFTDEQIVKYLKSFALLAMGKRTYEDHLKASAIARWMEDVDFNW